MKIEAGLFDHMVVQRDSRNVSKAGVSGTCEGKGPVTATVKRGGRVVKGFAAVPVGGASRGRFSGCLKGLPAGGPYDIELSIGDERVFVRDVLVGDVWLLGGQSNMQGCGLFPKRRLPPDPMIRAFYMDDRWAPARDPIHNLWDCVDPVHVDLCGGVRTTKPAPDWGVCPGPAFAAEMRRRTGVPQGLIACAHGGTSMTQWDPKRRDEGGKSLYGAMVRRLIKNGRHVAGLVWYQGCSDANPDAAERFTPRMKDLIAAVRRDSRDRGLPVAMVQIARVIGWGEGTSRPWNSIQDQQRRLSHVIRGVTTVPAIDLALDDSIHISGAGQYVLGRRLAQAMQVLREGRKAGRPPIALGNVRVEARRGLGVAVVAFENVEGRLAADGRPSGFSIETPYGAGNVFDTEIEGRHVWIRTTLSPDDLEGAQLCYGRGTDPYCNLRDEQGRPVPVFGPVPLGIPRAMTPFLRDCRVSAFQPSAGKLEELTCPANLDALGLAPRRFAENFCSLHSEIAQRGAVDEVVYYACAFSCAEPMKLALVLGYDGPVKAWVDGRELFHDPKGTNPATPSKGSARFDGGAGTHELVVALGTNSGMAWGIFLRLERLDLSKRLRLSGPEHYGLPTFQG